MKKAIKLIFDKLGYAVVDATQNAPEDLRGKIKDPRLAKYAARSPLFLIDAEVHKCTAFFRFSCGRDGNNPFIQTVKDYLKNGNIRYSGSKLEHYYNDSPANVAEMYSLEGELHEDLLTFPPGCVVFPWENCGMAARKEFREVQVKRETNRRGNKLSFQDGYGFVGPTNKERGELEVSTLVELTKSIQKNNYNRGNGHNEDIKASVLINGNDYQYFIKDGNHRITVLSALGHETAPVRVLPTSIPAFIYRGEAKFWPNVRNGIYTESQALKIFDTIFAGKTGIPVNQ